MVKIFFAVAILSSITGCLSHHKSSAPYSLVKIEMAIMDDREQNKWKPPYTVSDFRDRIYAAGPVAVPELAYALSKGYFFIVSHTLSDLLLDWPEAWEFLLKRLFEGVSREEGGHLLGALANAHSVWAQHLKGRNPFFIEMWVKHRTVLASYASLYSSDYVVEVVSVNHPGNKVRMRACDYAAYIIQEVAGVDFGARVWKSSDEAVEKAFAWYNDNLQLSKLPSREQLEEWLEKRNW